MSQWIVPNRNRPHRTRRQPGEEEDGNRSSHVHVHFPQRNLSFSNRLVSMPKYEAMELTWESEQQELVVDGHGELLLPMPSAKHSWGQSDDTLESIVRQATTVVDKRSSNLLQHDHTLAHISSTAPPPSGGEYVQSSIHEPIAAPMSRKRTWSDPECFERNTATSNSMHAEHDDLSICGGASARSCRDKETSLMSWASLESHRSLKTKNSIDDFARDDVLEEEHDIKGKTDGCSSTKRTRVAINHNQSERRRRDRINQRMKDLQELVPNGSKTDRASLLDDTIQYLKQLQAQIQFMCSLRTVPQMVMPLGMQQQHQLQMALLARVGLLDDDPMARSTAQSVARLLQPSCAAAFAPPPVLVPSMMSTTKPKANLSTGAFVPPADPFCTFLAQQCMNMDLYSKMVTLYCQEVNKTPRQTSKSIQAQRIEGIKEDKY